METRAVSFRAKASLALVHATSLGLRFWTFQLRLSLCRLLAMRKLCASGTLGLSEAVSCL